MNPEFFTLENGLKVVLLPMKNTKSVTVQFMVRTGAFYEKPNEYGLAHFLEHVCFKGTKTRSASSILQEFDSLGADYNAYTTSEFTGYYAKVRSEKFSSAFDILSDIYSNSIFPEKELETEKGVVIEEIRMYDDNPNSFLSKNFFAWIYEGQVAGHSITGKVENIKNLTRETVIDFYQRYYVPNNTVVVVSGNFNRKQVEKLINEKLSLLKSKPVKGHPKLKPLKTNKAVTTFKKNVEQNHLIIALPGEGAWSKEKSIQQVMVNILGGMMSSRLWRKVREEHGSAYYISAQERSFQDSGTIIIRAGLAKDKLETVLSDIFTEVKKMSQEFVSDQELSIAKENLLGGLFNGLESSLEWADYYGYLALMNRPLDPVSVEEGKIKSVTKEEVRKFAKKVLKNNAVYVAVLDNVDKDKILLNSLKSLY